jgi:hypothetical protein
MSRRLRRPILLGMTHAQPRSCVAVSEIDPVRTANGMYRDPSFSWDRLSQPVCTPLSVGCAFEFANVAATFRRAICSCFCRCLYRCRRLCRWSCSCRRLCLLGGRSFSSDINWPEIPGLQPLRKLFESITTLPTNCLGRHSEERLLRRRISSMLPRPDHYDKATFDVMSRANPHARRSASAIKMCRGHVYTYMPSHHRVIMHRFRLNTGRQSGQEGATMNQDVADTLQSQLIHHPEFLITQSAIRNRPNPLKIKGRHDF